jgi:Domain of unknown function (DUF4136)
MRFLREFSRSRGFRRAALVVAGASVVACASYDIRHDYDVDARFESYHTYAWIPQAADSVRQTATTAQANNALLDRRVRNAVDAAMAAKGFTRDDTDPDVRVVYHTGLKDKIDVSDWGYTYSGTYWGWAGRDIDVSTYTEGTLIVDLVNAHTRQLVWRGSATGAIQPKRSPEERTQAVNEVVRKIFEEYPPRQQ